MKNDIRFVAMDAHADTLAVSLSEGPGEVRRLGIIPNRPEAVRRLIRKLGPVEKLRVCYEAGPTGYVLYWQLTQMRVHCDVVAPTLVPVKPGDRVKTDRRGADKLAVRYRGGYLAPAVVAAPESMRAVIEALQALRGIAQVAAPTVVAEVGALSRFARPRQLMGYSGAVPREHSSGSSTWRGSITKTGNAHLRRIVGQASWSYRHRPAVLGALRQRQKGLGVEVKAIAWKAQHRLHDRYRRLIGKGKSKQQTITAITRELLGFIWAIGVHVEQGLGTAGRGAA